MRNRDTQKQEIVRQKAIELIVSQGIEGFSMNRLAKECQISVATLYIYYTDKEHLVKTIGIEIGQRFFCEMMKDFSPDMPFAEGLRRQWENRAHFMMDHMDEMACWEVLQNSAYSEQIVQESVSGFKDIMVSFFDGAIARGELIPISKEVFWSIAYGPLYSLLRFHNKGKSMGGFPFSLTAEMQQTAFNLVIKALTP